MHQWNRLDRPLILASGSPRRKEILGNMEFDFTIVKPSLPNEDEYIDPERLKESLQELALAKARSILPAHASSLIFGSDTIVVLDNEVIVKPVDYQDAQKMLRRLSGRMHKVYSSVALICENIQFTKTALACTEVFFRKVPDDEIDAYLDKNEYADKAGAYAIQGKAMTFVDRIQGCFYNVMGLPISETIALFNAYFAFMKGQ